MADTAVAKKDLSIVLTREFDAPVALVYKCWTDPQFLAQWWGPHGMRASAEMEVRAGGKFRLTMHSSNGEDYPLTGEFLDVVEERSLVMEMHLDDHPANWHDYLAEAFRKAGGDEDTLPSLTVVTKVGFLALSPERTRLTVEQVFATAAERDAFAEMGSAQGWGQSFEKLDALLERQ
jgi:uncharacterized protein YndB with AHSA1/START domain